MHVSIFKSSVIEQYYRYENLVSCYNVFSMLSLLLVDTAWMEIERVMYRNYMMEELVHNK